MSRIVKSSIPIPEGVEVNFQNRLMTIKGSKGSLNYTIHADVEINSTDNVLFFVPHHSSKVANALTRTAHAVANNMMQGVKRGFEKRLSLVGVGYRATMQGKVLNLTLGFSHPVQYSIPDGIVIKTPSSVEIVIEGIDKQLVGRVAASIRAYRPPEPYKGKGIRYSDEIIVIKETKKK